MISKHNGVIFNRVGFYPRLKGFKLNENLTYVKNIKVSKGLISIHFTNYQKLIIIGPLVTNDSYLVLPAD